MSGFRTAEEQLALSEERLRLATEAAGVGTWDYDLARDVIEWPPKTRAMFGIFSDRPCSLDDLYAALHPEDRGKVQASFSAAIDPAIRATYSAEYRVIGLEDGVERVIAAKGKGLFDEDGRCIRALGTSIDITEARAATRRRELLLILSDKLRTKRDPRAMMQAAVDCLGREMAVDRVGFGFVDGTVTRIESECVKGVAPLSGLYPLTVFAADIDALRAGEVFVRSEHTVDRADPAEPDLDGSAILTVPLIRDGALRAILYLVRSVAHEWAPGEIALAAEVASRLWEAVERARAQDELLQLNATLERQVASRTRERDQIWQAATDMLCVANGEGYFVSLNPAWEDVLGWSAEDLKAVPFLDFVHEDDRDATLIAAARLAKGEPQFTFENRYRRVDGTYCWFSWNAVPRDGLIYATVRDITANKQQSEALAAAEEALRQSQKMEAVGQLTGGLAHDFNNLLTGIAGSLELLERRIEQGRIADVSRYVASAQGAARRAAALTHRLLAFSRRQTLDPKPTDVNRLVAGMEDLIRRTVGPSIAVEVVGAGGLWPALIDPNQLENALLNLCINARDAMPDGGRITIETANKWLDERAAMQRDIEPGQYLALCVTDTGTGMTPDVIGKAFDPFFTTKPLGVGTGLGLSMIYGFARQSGGAVRIYSELGQGTTMCLYLPRFRGSSDAVEPESERPDAPRAQDGETVLVVDDEPTVRMLVTEVLEDLGYAALEAMDGASGLKILSSGCRVDLLVTDVGLPGGMNGRQLADAARLARPSLKVLFITGYAENAVVGNGHLDHGMALLTKPFEIDVLASRIRDMIEAPPRKAPFVARD